MSYEQEAEEQRQRWLKQEERKQQEIAAATQQAQANQAARAVPSTTAESSLAGQEGASPSPTGPGPDQLGAEESTLGNIFKGAGEIGGQLIGGAFDGIDSMFNLAHDLSPENFDEVDILPNIERLKTQDDVGEGAGKITQEEFDAQVVNAGVAEFARGAAQFGVGVFPGLSFVKVAKGAAVGLKAYKAAKLLGGAGAAGTVVRGATWGAVADFMAFDGNEGRITDILAENSEQYPWMENFVIDALKSDGEASIDPETGQIVYTEEDGLGGRIKNTIEGGILGVTIDGLGVAIRNLRGKNAAISKGVDFGNSAKELAPVTSNHSNLTSLGASLDGLDRYERALGTEISNPEALRESLTQLKLANPEIAGKVETDVRAIAQLKEELTTEYTAHVDDWVKKRTSPDAAKLSDETWEEMDATAKHYLAPEQQAIIDKYKSIPRSAREKALLASAENTADRNRYQALLAKDKMDLDAVESGFGAHAAPEGLNDLDSEALKSYTKSLETGDITDLVRVMKEGGKIPMVKAPQLRGGTVEEFLAHASGEIPLDEGIILKATRAAGLGDGATLKAGTALTEADVAARQALTNERATLKTKRAPKGATKEAKAKIKADNDAVRARQKKIDEDLAKTETTARGQRKAGDNSMTDVEIRKAAAKERRLLKANTPETKKKWSDFMNGDVPVREVPVMVYMARQIKMAVDASLVKYAIDENQLGSLPIEDLANFQELLVLSGRMEDAINGVASQTGGALRSLRMSPRSSGAAAEAWVKNVKNAEYLAKGLSTQELASRQMAAILGATDDMLGKVITDQTKPGRMDYALHYWTNSLLSGTQTLSIQPISGAMMTLFMPFEAAIGSVMKGDLRAAGADLSGLYGLVQSFKGMTKAIAGTADNLEKVVPKRNGTQVLDNTAAAWKSGKGQLDARTMADEGTRAMGQGDLLLNEGSAMDKLTHAAETVVGLPSRIIATSDEMAKGLNYNVKLMQDGYRAAATDGAANASEAATSHMNKVANWDTLEDPIERAAYRKYHEEAIEYARGITFQKEATEGGLTQSIQGFVARHPMARVVMPFVRTPANILKFTWERTPVLSRLIKEDQRIMASTLAEDAPKIAAIQARRRVGTALWASSMYLGSEGYITGGAPREPGAREAWKRAGVPEYSYYAGEDEDGKKIWKSFQRTDPLGMFLGISADLSRLFVEMDEEDASVQELVVAGMAALSDNIKSRSYLNGVSQLMHAIENPARRGEAYVGSQVSNLIPNIFAQSRRYGVFGEGDSMREVDSILERMMNRVPGVSSALAPKLNIFGDYMYADTGRFPGADMINPFFAVESEFGPDQIKALRRGELSLLDIGDGTPSGKKDRVSAAALMLDYKTNMKTAYQQIDGVELTPEQKNKWIQGASDGLADELYAVISSPTWKYLSKPVPGDEDQSSQYKVFRRIIQGKKARARERLLQSDKALQASVMNARLQKIANQTSGLPDAGLAGR